LAHSSEKTILIVDDEIIYHKILSRILSKYNILTAGNGEEALEKFNSGEKIDLIFLDIDLPGMTGLEVAIKIKNDFPSLSIPIIFLSARSDLDSYVEGFEIGAIEYITKPFDNAEVVRIAEENLKSNS